MSICTFTFSVGVNSATAQTEIEGSNAYYNFYKNIPYNGKYI